MTSIVGLLLCPLLCLYSIGDTWLSCVVWHYILGVALVCGHVPQSIYMYVLGLLGLHLNMSHAATSRPLGKSKEHQLSQWKPVTAGWLECLLSRALAHSTLSLYMV